VYNRAAAHEQQHEVEAERVYPKTIYIYIYIYNYCSGELGDITSWLEE